MIYLDNSATTRVLDSAAAVAGKYMTELFFNPSSAYTPAVNVERDIKSARAHMAKVMGCSADEVIYTSGGTESNNAAIFGTVKQMRGKIRAICSSVEHSSVYESFKRLEGMGHEVIFAPVNPDGSLNMQAFSELLTPDVGLVSIMHVNNETGAINDLSACRKLISQKSPNAVFHSDGVQAFLKLPFGRVPCDLYSVSGHKFHAPKGIGALYVKNGTRFAGSLVGGGQERGLRSGTLNAPGIMAMDEALKFYETEHDKKLNAMREVKVHLAENLLTIPNAVVNGPDYNAGAPHILNVSFPGVRGETLLHALAEKGVYISTGSACSSHKKGNRILDAMGITGERKEGAVRLSLCCMTTLDEVDRASSMIRDTVAFLRRYQRR